MFYELEYTRQQAQEILGKVAKLDHPLPDPTWRLYRQKARKLCGQNICPRAAKVIYASELAVLCWIAHCRSNKIYKQLEDQSLYGSSGFPYKKAQKFAEKFGICFGEIKRHA